MEHKANDGAVAKAAGESVPPPVFMRRDAATINALAVRANEAEHGGAPLTASEKLALELAVKDGLITAEPGKLEKPAVELMAEGLRQAHEKRIEDAIAAVDELERIALEVRKVRVGPDWFDFKAKRAATAKTAELRARFDKAKAQLYGEVLRADNDQAFKAEVDEHIGSLESVFGSPFRKPE